MTVGVDLGGQLQIGNDLGRLLQVDVGHRHHLAVEQGLTATTDMVLADGPGADDAQLQRHVENSFRIVGAISIDGPWPVVH
ncbi:hypothetical protein D3C76_1634420 [compost metagenome]